VTDESLYVRDGDAFIGLPSTVGGWNEQHQSGGAVLALLGHLLEDVPSITPMSLSRLTVDLFRPVPIGRPMRIAVDVLREGAKIQLLELVVSIDGTEHVRARALRVRDADLTALDGLPPSTSDVHPAGTLPGPEALGGMHEHENAYMSGFLRIGIEVRRTAEPVGGLHGLWIRFRVPAVIAGEPIRATSRATMPVDCVNLIGVDIAARLPITGLNPDVSAHLVRPPVGEWVVLTGNTWFAHGIGHGVSAATLSDEQGAFGVTSTSQLIQPTG
jgi:Thioesterase-like superfamily